MMPQGPQTPQEGAREGLYSQCSPDVAETPVEVENGENMTRFWKELIPQTLQFLKPQPLTSLFSKKTSVFRCSWHPS